MERKKKTDKRQGGADFVNGAGIDKGIWSENSDMKKGVTLSLYGNLFREFKAELLKKGQSPSDLFNELMKKELGYK